MGITGDQIIEDSLGTTVSEAQVVLVRAFRGSLGDHDDGIQVTRQIREETVQPGKGLPVGEVVSVERSLVHREKDPDLLRKKRRPASEKHQQDQGKAEARRKSMMFSVC